MRPIGSKNKKGTKANRVMFRCNDEDLEKIDNLADNFNTTRSKIIMAIIKKYLNGKGDDNKLIKYID